MGVCVCVEERERERERETKIEKERDGAQRRLNENKKAKAAVSYIGCFADIQTEEQIEKMYREWELGAFHLKPRFKAVKIEACRFMAAISPTDKV